MDAWDAAYYIFVCFSKVKFKGHANALSQKGRMEETLKQQCPNYSNAPIPSMVSFGQWH